MGVVDDALVQQKQLEAEKVVYCSKEDFDALVRLYLREEISMTAIAAALKVGKDKACRTVLSRIRLMLSEGKLIIR